MAEANTERPAAVFRDIAAALIPIAARAVRRPREALIRPARRHPDPAQAGPWLEPADQRFFAWAEASARTRAEIASAP